MHPSHGDLWDAKCIENGSRFYDIIRAKDKSEAEEVGQEMAELSGAQCYAVSQHRE